MSCGARNELPVRRHLEQPIPAFCKENLMADVMPPIAANPDEDDALRARYRQHLAASDAIIMRHAAIALRQGGGSIRAAARILADLASADEALGREVQALEALSEQLGWGQDGADGTSSNRGAERRQGALCCRQHSESGGTAKGQSQPDHAAGGGAARRRSREFDQSADPPSQGRQRHGTGCLIFARTVTPPTARPCGRRRPVDRFGSS